MRDALRIGAEVGREAPRILQLPGQLRRCAARIFFQLRQLNGQQREPLTDVVMQLARDARPLLVLHAREPIAERLHLRFRPDPLRDVLIDAEAADEIAARDERDRVELDIHPAPVLAAPETSRVDDLALQDATADLLGFGALAETDERVGILAEHLALFVLKDALKRRVAETDAMILAAHHDSVRTVGDQNLQQRCTLLQLLLLALTVRNVEARAHDGRQAFVLDHLRR